MDNGAEYYRCFLNGEKEALNRLIHEYWDGLALYLGNITDSFAEAEEMAEETFVKLYTDKPNYSGKSSFKTWLYAVGRNTALYHMRKRRKMYEISENGEYDISDREDIERNCIKGEDKRHLLRAMERLNPDYRQVLYLVYFEDFTNTEAARIMDKNERQIRNLLYRSKGALKEILLEEGFEYDGL
ncbi:MAG: RNA polymerase sigma factor [Ruminococcus sp.]|nr:RNA polymerase sigma factor [Ruminococcus sp.]